MSGRVRLAVTVTVLATAGGLSACGPAAHGAASSPYPISGPACMGGWSCLTTNAKTIKQPIVAPDPADGDLVERTVDAYQLTPSATEVDFSYFAKSQSAMTRVREVRGGPKPLCADRQPSVAVQVRGVTGTWQAGSRQSLLCWQDSVWTIGMAVPPGVSVQQAAAAADAMVVYPSSA